MCGSRAARQVWERMEDRVEGCNSVVVRGRIVRISSRFESELDYRIISCERWTDMCAKFMESGATISSSTLNKLQ